MQSRAEMPGFVVWDSWIFEPAVSDACSLSAHPLSPCPRRSKHRPTTLSLPSDHPQTHKKLRIFPHHSHLPTVYYLHEHPRYIIFIRLRPIPNLLSSPHLRKTPPPPRPRSRRILSRVPGLPPRPDPLRKMVHPNLHRRRPRPDFDFRHRLYLLINT